MTSLELQHLTSTLHSFRNEAKRRSLLQKSIDTAKISDKHAVHSVASVICTSDQHLDEYAHLLAREQRRKQLKTSVSSTYQISDHALDGKLMKDVT